MWKDVCDFEGLYQVNELGEIKSVERTKKNNAGIQAVNERILKQRTDKDGYFAVCLCKDGKHYGRRVNRLVAEAFIPNPDDLPVVHHKDENKQNNNVDNLEWCTVQYNTCYGEGLKSGAIKRGRPVIQLDNGVVINEYYSTGNASDETGIPQGNIYNACAGKRRIAGGYEWRFKDEY